MRGEKLNMTYQEFLESKITIAKNTGFEISKEEIKSYNKSDIEFKPHQIDAVQWALSGGCRALFESFGLGKTIQQILICKIITEKENGKALIICPLGVKQEFTNDAKIFFDMELEYIKTLADAKISKNKIFITNYERVRDGDIDPNYFLTTTLDEAAVLRSYGSKTYQTFLTLFRNVKYKFVATATPSPNKYKELIHYAGYLGIMDTGQALTRFFKRDSTKANKLTIHPHKEKEFWLWVSSWALFITKPSDLGYDDTGYDLPDLKIHYHKLNVDHTTAGIETNGQIKMFRDATLSLQDASKEKRDSLKDRINKMMEIIKENNDNHFIIWHDLEAERHAIKKALPEVKEVFGSLDLDIREQRILDFSYGKFKYLATKPRISGSGCNFQRYCHKAIFLGIGYKFADFIQAIHRIYRFLQTYQVEIHIIYTESENEILKTLLKKWEQHNYLVNQMLLIIKKYGLSNLKIADKLKRTIGVDRMETKGNYFHAILNDNIIECQNMKDNTIDLIHTSIPFSNHYEYTPTYNDFGHNEDNDKFFDQMDYLTPELLRILKPGRVAAIHVKDRILFGNATGDGMPTVDPFSDLTTAHFLKHGFRFFGRITIVTDVVRENNQTYRLGWSEQCKDGSKMGVGCPEYILLFRKLPTDTSKAYADTPVKKSKIEYPRGQWQIDAHAFWRSSGDRFLTPEELKNIPVENLQGIYYNHSLKNIYNYKEHVDLANNLDNKNKLPASFMVCAPASWTDYIWHDINRMLTLNSSQSAKNKNMHICPLQFDIVDRIITRFSNKDEIIMDPFAGLMTVPVRAIKLGRRAIGIELNIDSYNDGLSYLNAIDEEMSFPTLFNLGKAI